MIAIAIVVGVVLACRGLDEFILDARRWYHRKLRKNLVVCDKCEGTGSLVAK